MPTNIGSNGGYPIWDIWERHVPSFETVWKEHLSLAPEVPTDWKEAERFKSFAKRIYGHIDIDGFIQNVADQAYNDGYEDGYNKGGEEMKKQVQDAIGKIL